MDQSSNWENDAGSSDSDSASANNSIPQRTAFAMNGNGDSKVGLQATNAEETELTISLVEELRSQILKTSVKEDSIRTVSRKWLLSQWREKLQNTPYFLANADTINAILMCARLAVLRDHNELIRAYEILRAIDWETADIESEDERSFETDSERALSIKDQIRKHWKRVKEQERQQGFGEEWPINIFTNPDSPENLETYRKVFGDTNDSRWCNLLSFSVHHVRAGYRYHQKELGIIIIQLLKEYINENIVTEGCNELPSARKNEKLGKAQQQLAMIGRRLTGGNDEDYQADSQELDDLKKHATAFVLEYADFKIRAIRSLEAAEKRYSARNGFVLLPESDLDAWYCDVRETDKDKTNMRDLIRILDAEIILYQNYLAHRPSEKHRTSKTEFPLLKVKAEGIGAINKAMRQYADIKQKVMILQKATKTCVCVRGALDKFDSISQDENQASISAGQTERTRIIAVFGYFTAKEDEALIQNCSDFDNVAVVVRLVSKPQSSDEQDSRAFEVGLRHSGTYLKMNPSNIQELNGMIKSPGIGLNENDELVFYEFVRKGDHRPGAVTLESILGHGNETRIATGQDSSDKVGKSCGQASYALLVVPDVQQVNNTHDKKFQQAYSELAEAGSRFLISLTETAAIAMEGLQFSCISVLPTHSVIPELESTTDCSFWRMALLLPPVKEHTGKIVRLHRLGNLTKKYNISSGKGGYLESAEIIMAVLGLENADESQQCGPEDPSLLYFTSLELIQDINPRLCRKVVCRWEQRLRVRTTGYELDEQEAREMVFKLITAELGHGSRSLGVELPPSFAQESPEQDVNTQQSSDRLQLQLRVGRHRTAMASLAHFRHIPVIISTENCFSQETISVEESNADSIIQKLESKNKQDSLYFVVLTVTGRISPQKLEQLVGRASKSLRIIIMHMESLPSLLAMTKANDLVYYPQSIEMKSRKFFERVTYTASSTVGSLVLSATRRLLKFPSEIEGIALRAFDGAKQQVQTSMKWVCSLRQWAQEKSKQMSSICRVLVTVDFELTAQQLELQNIILEVYDAGDYNSFSKAQNFLSQFSAEKLESQVAAMGVDDTRLIIVVKKASYWPSLRLEAVLSRCCEKNIKILFLVGEATSMFARFNVLCTKFSRKKTSIIPQIMHQRIFVPAIVERRDRDSSILWLSLYLVYGPRVIFSMEHYQEMINYLKQSSEPSAKMNMLPSLASSFGIEEDQKEGHQAFFSTVCSLLRQQFTSEPKLAGTHVGQIVFDYVKENLHIEQFAWVCFQDFISQPQCRFLSQIHRVEAWLCVLENKTYKLPSLASRFPSADNTHSPNLGRFMSCKQAEITDFSSIVTIIDPSCTDSGHGDVISRVDDILENVSLTAGMELNWEDSESSGRDAPKEVKNHLLIQSPLRLSLLLSMDVQNIADFTLDTFPEVETGHEETCPCAWDAIKGDLVAVQSAMSYIYYLDEASHDERSCLHKDTLSKLAAVAWLLVKSIPCNNKRLTLGHELLTPDVIMRLIDCSVQIAPQKRPDTLAQVLCTTITMDHPTSIFLLQAGIREFLFSNDPRVEQVLIDKSIKIGQAFFELVLTSSYRDDILSGKKGKAIFSELGAILEWTSRNCRDRERVVQSMLHSSYASRFTAAAVATILCSITDGTGMNGKGLLEESVDIFLKPCLKTQGSLFLQLVLEGLAREPSKMILIMEQIACTQECQALSLDLSAVHPVWTLVYDAFCKNSMSKVIQAFESQQKEPEKIIGTRQKSVMELKSIPLELSEKLCGLYVMEFTGDVLDSRNDIKTHKILLPNSNSRIAIHQKMLKMLQCQKGPPEHGIHSFAAQERWLLLLWFTWAQQPSQPLSILPSSKKQRDLFKTAIREGDLAKHAKDAGVTLSAVGRFFVAPWTLSTPMVNSLFKTLVDPVKCEGCFPGLAFLIAQVDNDTYPPYSLRCHRRNLPRDIIENLVSTVKISPEQSLKRLHFPVVNSGVSKQALQHNLNLLTFKLKTLKNHAAIHQIGQCILAWLHSAGFKMKDLLSMCDNRKTQDELKRQIKSVKSVPETAVRNLVMEPLPTFIEVRHVNEEEKAIPLFGRTPESLSLTIQLVRAIILRYEITSEFFCGEHELEQLKEYAELPKSKDNKTQVLGSTAEVDWNSQYKEIVMSLLRQVTINISQRSDGFGSNFVDEFIPIADFFIQIRSSPFQGGVDLAKSAITGIVEGLKFLKINTDNGSLFDDLTSAVADAIFILVGLTPENQGHEICTLLSLYATNQFKSSMTVVQEIRYMRNIYASDTDSSEVVKLIDSFSMPSVHAFKRDIQAKEYIGKFLLSFDLEQDTTTERESNIYEEWLLADADDHLSPEVVPATTSVLSLRQTMLDHAVGIPIREIRSLPLDYKPLFQQYTVEKRSKAGFATSVGSFSYVSDQLKPNVRTVSARAYIVCEKKARYGIVKVQPGLHPILYKKNDWIKIPFLRLSSVGTNGVDPSALDRIFSHNGLAWDYLSKLPIDSTIVCKGFYLRRACNGHWMLLLSASRQSEVRAPSLYLWNVLDVRRLAALDFDSHVVEFLGLIVFSCMTLAEKDELSQQDFCVLDLCGTDRMTRMLDSLREAAADKNGDFIKKYLKYESIMSANLKNVVHKLLKGGSVKTSIDALLLESTAKLEKELEKVGRPVVSKTLTPVFKRLAAHLAIIIGPSDKIPRSQLVHILQKVLYHHDQNKTNAEEDDSDGAEENGVGEDEDLYGEEDEDLLVAPHEHLTQRKFRKASVEIVTKLEEDSNLLPMEFEVKQFSDSDEDDDDSTHHRHQRGRHCTSKIRQVSDNERLHVKAHTKDHHTDRSISESCNSYQNGDLDWNSVAQGQQAPLCFPHSEGYGRPVTSNTGVISMLDKPVPLVFAAVNVRRFKIEYTPDSGLEIGYIFLKKIFERSLQNSEHNKPMHRSQLLDWLINVCRSPIPELVKQWFLNKLEFGPTAVNMDQLCPTKGHTVDTEAQDCPKEIINCLVIADCIARSFPCELNDPIRPILCESFSKSLSLELQMICERKNNMYGVHIVDGNMFENLRRKHIEVGLQDFSYDRFTKSNSTMFLDISRIFSRHVWLVYVRGLRQISDQLLKWLCEYTKDHPWRFVYLESTDTSWNFGENRDRCILRAAPPLATRLHKLSDLTDTFSIAQQLPTHQAQYADCFVPSIASLNAQSEKLWSNLNEWALKAFMRNESGWKPEGKRSISDKITLLFIEDFEQPVKVVMKQGPCAVLLVSPPGTGKSYFSDQLGQYLISEMSLSKAFVDGSDPELVDTALTEILERELSDSSHQLLIVDEFHMLSQDQKQDLFRLLEHRGSKLHVLLLANRYDSFDIGLLENLATLDVYKQCQVDAINIHRLKQVCQIQTRLGKAKIQTVMEHRKSEQKCQILRWMHCSRCLFGGEAISLRLIEELNSIFILRKEDHQKKLVDLLIHKIPTISQITAVEFVEAFETSLNMQDNKDVKTFELIGKKVAGPIGMMVQAAILTELEDKGTDFVDFIATELKHAYEAAPVVRMLAWILHMRSVSDQNSALRSQFDKKSPMELLDPQSNSLFVDQVGFPIQLVSEKSLELSSGPAISWSGDYSSMKEIIDAVKRGHSVDWADVKASWWDNHDIKEIDELIQLLTSCRSPQKVLQAVQHKNLCSLLRRSHPKDAKTLAGLILKNRTRYDKVEEDGYYSPFRASVWITIVYEEITLLPSPKEHWNDLLLMLLGKEREEDSEAFFVQSDADLFDALAWAAMNMNSNLECIGDPGERECFLQMVLEQLSIKLIAAQAQSQLANTMSLRELPDIWCVNFARLLWGRVENEFCTGNKPVGVALNIITEVVKSAKDCERDWPEPVPALWRIAKKRAAASDVNHVWKSFPQFILDGDRDPSTSPVLKDFAGGILSATAGLLDQELQIALLTRNGCVPDEDFGDKDDHIWESVIGLALDQLSPSQIQLQEGLFRDKVLQHLNNRE